MGESAGEGNECLGLVTHASLIYNTLDNVGVLYDAPRSSYAARAQDDGMLP